MSDPTQAEFKAWVERWADMMITLANVPQILAHSEGLLELARETGNKDLIRLLETANELATLRYGKISGIEKRVILAEMIRQGGNLRSQLCQRVFAALADGDTDFLNDLTKALEMVKEKPNATRDARFWALSTVRQFRLADIEPTKADVREHVEALMRKMNRARGGVRWQRDVWPSHPELAALPDRKRGETPNRLPELE